MTDAPRDQTWRLSRDLAVVAKPGSGAALAINEVFGATDIAREIGPVQSRAKLAIDVRMSHGGVPVLFVNELPVARVTGPDAIAPMLEGTLCGFAVRTRSEAAALHAATIELDGKGICLLGTKGSGKSTLSLLLGNEGAAYFGDEITFVRYSDLGIEAFPKAATMKVGSFALFAEKQTHVDPVRGPVRYYLPHTAVTATRETTPQLILLPRYNADAGACRVRELDPGEAALELVKQSFGGLERDPRMIHVIARLAELPAYTFEFPDSRSAIAAVHELAALVG